jgi:hypothetical protein
MKSSKYALWFVLGIALIYVTFVAKTWLEFAQAMLAVSGVLMVLSYILSVIDATRYHESVVTAAIEVLRDFIRSYTDIFVFFQYVGLGVLIAWGAKWLGLVDNGWLEEFYTSGRFIPYFVILDLSRVSLLLLWGKVTDLIEVYLQKHAWYRKGYKKSDHPESDPQTAQITGMFILFTVGAFIAELFIRVFTLSWPIYMYR